MAYIKTLKDNELVGGTDNNDVYPVSSTQAIYSQSPDGTVPSGIRHQKLEDRLQDHESDAKELHRKSEKLVVYLNNNQSGTKEIKQDTVYTMTVIGTAELETYGDEPSENIKIEDMDTKHITVISGSASLEVTENASGEYGWQGICVLPNAVGTYRATFEVNYNGVSKSVNSDANLNLRKYFCYMAEQPSSVEDMITLQEKAISDFSNSVGCTVTIPANGTGYKRVYFAVPSGMTITRVIQPDALNAPLVLANQANPTIINRTINGYNYQYKLYWSADLIDSSVSKRLTIS